MGDEGVQVTLPRAGTVPEPEAVATTAPDASRTVTATENAVLDVALFQISTEGESVASANGAPAVHVMAPVTLDGA